MNVEPGQSPSGKAFVNSAYYIWRAAAASAQRATAAKAVAPWLPTSDTLSAIILAATSAEAFINELGQLTLYLAEAFPILGGEPDWQRVGTTLVALEAARKPTTTKYMTASELLPGKPLEEGADPYQDFARLMEVRNEFVHPKAQGRSPRFFAFFVDREWTYTRKDNPLNLVGWRTQLETPEVAKWACRAAFDVMADIADRYQSGTSQLAQTIHSTLHQYWMPEMKDDRVY